MDDSLPGFSGKANRVSELFPDPTGLDMGEGAAAYGSAPAPCAIRAGTVHGRRSVLAMGFPA